MINKKQVIFYSIPHLSFPCDFLEINYLPRNKKIMEDGNGKVPHKGTGNYFLFYCCLLVIISQA